MKQEKLEVYWGNEQVGVLIRSGNKLSFSYQKSWLNSASPRPISQSLALQENLITSEAVKNYFTGLLPESMAREKIARTFGVSPENTFALLREIGRECAGAISIWPEGKSPTSILSNDNYKLLDDKLLLKYIRQLPSHPLLIKTENVRLSLAGAQDKFLVRKINNKLYLCLDGALSTHIIKPNASEQNESYPGIVRNEAFCLLLAAKLNIPAAKARIVYKGFGSFLCIERYDRYEDDNQQLQSIHQEDFCQALGLHPIQKYQNEGGPSLSDCFNLVRECSSMPAEDLNHLLRVVILNYLIGNHDAHGKNFSLIYCPDGQNRIAPFYDLLSTVIYPGLTSKMAMKIGGKYEPEWLFKERWQRFAKECDLSEKLVFQVLQQFSQQILSTAIHLASEHFSKDETIAKILEVIKQRVAQLNERIK